MNSRPPPHEPALIQKQLAIWAKGIPDEVDFWSHWLCTRGGHWPEDFRARLDPTTPLRADLAQIVEGSGKRTVHILDVGAGPITNIGYNFPGVDLEVVAVDPLSQIYSKLLVDAGVVAPVPTKFATAEDLSIFFEYDQFDIVHCSNALDHSLDPIRALLEMVDITKVGGLVRLTHHENEAMMESYLGMHQHNFTVQDGEFIIWDREHTINVNHLFGSRVAIEATLYGETINRLIKRGVAVTIRKTEPSPRKASGATDRQRARELLEGIVGVLTAPSLDQ